jgi:type I restriction enzyme S subunit
LAGVLLGFRLAIPPTEVLSHFGVMTDPLFERITANTRESRTLAALRDALLPKLISGELRVPEAEELVEAAVGSRRGATTTRRTP